MLNSKSSDILSDGPENDILRSEFYEKPYYYGLIICIQMFQTIVVLTSVDTLLHHIVQMLIQRLKIPLNYVSFVSLV